MNDDYEIEENDINIDDKSFNNNISNQNTINNISNFNESSIDIGEKFIGPICNRILGEIISNNCNHFSCKRCLYNFIKIIEINLILLNV